MADEDPIEPQRRRRLTLRQKEVLTQIQVVGMTIEEEGRKTGTTLNTLLKHGLIESQTPAGENAITVYNVTNQGRSQLTVTRIETKVTDPEDLLSVLDRAPDDDIQPRKKEYRPKLGDRVQHREFPKIEGCVTEIIEAERTFYLCFQTGKIMKKSTEAFDWNLFVSLDENVDECDCR